MVAVAHLPPAQGRRLALVHSAPLPRPVAVRASVATYRRRRAVALLAAATVTLCLSLAAHALLGAPGGAHTLPGRAASTGGVYVVQPGDTFWAIARMLSPQGDPRPLVARMVAAHGSTVLRVGEHLSLPLAA